MDHLHTEFKVFSGNANKPLALEICKLLGLELGKADVGKFSNGETTVMIHESIRAMDVYIIQPICSNGKLELTVNDALFELLVMADAFKRASCRRLVAVVPFMGYARQSKKHKSRTPITAKLVANMMETAGYDRVITVDLHASQIQGFFDIPVDNLFAEPLIMKYITKRIKGDKVVVAPGVGGVKRAKLVADKLDTDLAILHKLHDGGGVQMILVGDVTDKTALIIDDIADTCETLLLATRTLIAKGAQQVIALISHGLFSNNAISKINEEESLVEVVVTNSAPNHCNEEACKKLRVMNIAPMLAEAIRRIHHGESFASFFG